MNERGKSDGPVVPANPPNKAATAVVAAEVGEERGPAKGNTTSKTRPGHRAGPGAPSALNRVREVARRDKEARFTALLHHVDLARLRSAFWAISPKAAPGVDGVTWADYRQDLDANLRGLHERLQAGRYRAKPSRRAYIPKADGRQRPLGIATLEDKIVQRAVVEVLNAIYEVDFRAFSYGFRPGRGPHHALDALTVGIEKKRVNWVLDADVREFFTNLDHRWLVRFLEHRIADKRVLRLIQKWLAAGVIEDGEWSETTQGSPQGASASPLLANVYLHYVFDLWADWWRRNHARGDVIIVRFADDFTMGFEYEQDARRFLTELGDRFAKFGLALHPDKTRLIEFGRFAAERRRRRGQPKPETFDFLGFTHMCAKTRSGRFWVRRVTISKRMRAKLSEVKTELRRRRHDPIPDQGQWLAAVVRGHRAYYAVPGNTDAVGAFRDQVTRHWLQALRRRSQRNRLTWARMHRIAKRWLPPARVMHPFPAQRLAAIT
ncbi:MAG: group II intron reverse transcriptase/maturase [Rhodococcus sp. (in: high G+C Gram-positive bacteria)]|nr:MAG: group II intron reverse transcriptase/maturase [Rhodococcus sp. (in: high G+C Gram-positive bacteria)]